MGCVSRTWKGLTSSFFLGRRFNKLVVLNCICKNNWLCSFKKKKKIFHSVQSAITHSQSFRGYHSASLLLSPQVSLTVAPFLGAQGGDQSPLLPVGVGSCPGALPYPVAVPGELVRPSNESGQGSAIRRGRTSVEREPGIPSGGCLLLHRRVPSFQPCQATSLTAQGTGVVGISPGPPEMLQKPVLKKPSTTHAELENSGLLRWRAQRN